MKKIFSLVLACTMLFSLVACSSTPTGAGDAIMNGGSGYKGDAIGDGFLGDAMAPEAAPGEPGGEVDIIPPETGNAQRPTAGLLTAGEWKDVEDLAFWKTLLNRNDWYALMEARDVFPNNIVSVFVHDVAGNPCYNVPVRLANDDAVIYTARTGVNGMAYLANKLTKDGPTATKVLVGDQTLDIGEGVLDVTAEMAGIQVEALDLMLMIDTTGSMNDELKYLQKELENVIERVADASKTLSIHVSVNFYRDEDDTYVVRHFEFTSDIKQALKDLNAQSTDGGGDYPEAVHKALDNAIQAHQWRENAVKLMFFVLDAPPHTESEIQGINHQMTNTVKLAAENGIRIIPLASSGVNTETEFLLRTWAVMTGGTYTFLTNHSGIGNDHLEPTIGEYKVEKLNECMIRVISEYCGLEYSATTQDQQ